MMTTTTMMTMTMMTMMTTDRFAWVGLVFLTGLAWAQCVIESNSLWQ